MAIAGASYLALRIPVVLATAAGTGLLFYSLKRFLPLGESFCIALLSACPNSAIAVYSSLSIGNYGLCLLLCSGLLLLSIYVDQNRREIAWLLLGTAIGMAIYIFELLALESAVIIGWLFFALGTRLAPILTRLGDNGPQPRNILRLVLMPMASAVMFAVGPVLLLGPDPYSHFGRLVAWLSFPIAAACLLIAVSRVFRYMPIRRSELMMVALLIAPIAIIPGIAKWHFKQHIAPLWKVSGAEVWDNGGGYKLKKVTDYPYQAMILIDRVIPALFFGRFRELRNGADEVSFTPHAIASAAIVALTLVAFYGAFRRWRHERLSLLYVWPAFMGLLIVVLFPSWRLFGDFSYRYLIAGIPGWYVVLVCGIASLGRWQRRLGVGILHIYLLYCGFDLWNNVRATSVDSNAHHYADIVQKSGADLCIVRAKMGPEVMLLLNDVPRVDIVSPPVYPFYPAEGQLNAANRICLIGLEPELFCKDWGPPACKFQFKHHLDPFVWTGQRWAK